MLLRLQEAGLVEKAAQELSYHLYQRTAKGEAELAENPYVAYICDRNTITLWDMNRLLAGAKPGDSFQNLIWQYYQQKARECYELGHMEEFLGWRQTMLDFLLQKNAGGLPFITGAQFLPTSLLTWPIRTT